MEEAEADGLCAALVTRSGKVNQTQGVAVVVFKGEVLDRFYNMAEMLGGEWVWKKKAGAVWITILKMPRTDLQGYLNLLAPHGVEAHLAE